MAAALHFPIPNVDPVGEVEVAFLGDILYPVHEFTGVALHLQIIGNYYI